MTVEKITIDPAARYEIAPSNDALILYGSWPSGGSREERIACSVRTAYRGTRTSTRGAGGKNVEHGTATVTMPDGTVYTGQYEWGGDARRGSEIFHLQLATPPGK